MKAAIVAIFVLVMGSFAIAQEPVNHAVAQPVAYQPSASQPAVYQIAASSPVPVAIPTVFQPLPTIRHTPVTPAASGAALTVVQPRVSDVKLPVQKTCGCSK